MWMWLTPPSPPIPHRLLSPFSSASFFVSSSSSSSLPESGCPDQSREGRRSGGLWGRGSSGVAARGGWAAPLSGRPGWSGRSWDWCEQDWWSRWREGGRRSERRGSRWRDDLQHLQAGPKQSKSHPPAT